MKAHLDWSLTAVRSAGLALAMLALFACNNVGDCPAPSAIVPQGACSGDNLQCPFTLQSLNPQCDGTSIDGGVATSCVCTGGSWNCPSAVTCEAGPGADAGDDGGGGDGGGDAPTDAVGE